MASSRRWLRSRPRHPGVVPRWWDTAPSVAADLHRRMRRSLDAARRSVAEASRAGVPTEHYERLCDELDDAVGALDRQLVHASRLAVGLRHEALHGLRPRVADVERTAGRIGRAAVDAGAPLQAGIDAPLQRINERLDRHLEARAELRGLGARRTR